MNNTEFHATKPKIAKLYIGLGLPGHILLFLTIWAIIYLLKLIVIDCAVVGDIDYSNIIGYVTDSLACASIIYLALPVLMIMERQKQGLKWYITEEELNGK